MKHIGNYADWINPKWIEYMEANVGEKHPRINPDEYGKDNALEKIKQYGYKLEDTFWYSFEERSFPFKLKSPIELNGVSDWWFVKMLPGNFIPFHRDHPPKNECEGMIARRFWMPLQDYVEGHIFIMGHDFLKDYKAGDIFEYDNEGERHAACNLSMGISRYTFNFQVYH